MNPAGQLIGLVLVIALLFGSGVLSGRKSRQPEIDLLNTAVTTQTLRADNANLTLQGLKTTLTEERARRARMQQAADEELAGLTKTVAALTLAAERNEQDIRKKALKDEDCTVLRDLPVCGAVADGLWGRTTAAGTH
jgi:hypothetical protein